MNLLKLFVILSALQGAQGSYDTEKEIHASILSGYNAEVKPSGVNKSIRMDVFFDMRISKLVSLDIKEQVLTLDAFTMLRWKDENLSWNKTEYRDTDRINMKNTLIWTPDVVLINDAADGKAHTDLYRSKVMIDHTGLVVWVSPTTFQASCQVDVTWFPVDKQICNMTFGSFSYNAKQINLKFWSKPTSKANVISENFEITSGEWNIDQFESFEEDRLFTCCIEQFATITYRIHLHRLSRYYFLYLILPLIAQLFLFLLVFWIPIENGERMGFGITIILNVTLYLVLISEKLPEKSDQASVVGICFIVLFYVISSGLAFAAVTSFLAIKKTSPPSFLMRYLPGKSPNSRIHVDSSDVVLENIDAQKGEEAEIKTTTVDCKEKSYQTKWKEIVKKMDRYLFFTFTFLILVLPVIICLCFNTTHLGEI